MVYGDVVMRDHLADELDVEVHALDDQVATMIDRLIRGLAQSGDRDGQQT